jgi:hypothetical protein
MLSLVDIENFDEEENSYRKFRLNILGEPFKAFSIPYVRYNLNEFLKGKSNMQFDMNESFIKVAVDRSETFKNHIVCFFNEHILFKVVQVDLNLLSLCKNEIVEAILSRKSVSLEIKDDQGSLYMYGPQNLVNNFCKIINIYLSQDRVSEIISLKELLSNELKIF